MSWLSTGDGELLGDDVGDSGNDVFQTSFWRSLKTRGPAGISSFRPTHTLGERKISEPFVEQRERPGEERNLVNADVWPPPGTALADTERSIQRRGESAMWDSPPVPIARPLCSQRVGAHAWANALPTACDRRAPRDYHPTPRCLRRSLGALGVSVLIPVEG